MRIIAGQFRGLALVPVGKGDPAAHLRPTPDRVREALFSSLAARGVLLDAKVLDLFAGTGALGLEALSRGAARADFVENGRKSLALLEGNIARTRSAEARVWKQDARKLGPAPVAFDLVFLDPPYGKGMGGKALASANAAGWIAPGALVIWEEEQPQEPPIGFRLVEHKRYGRAHLTFLERVG